jgi:hypothetical protein
MPTWRSFAQRAYHCGWYEAEDVFSNCDDVELVLPRPGKRFHLTERWHQRLVWKDLSGLSAYLNPGLHTIRLTKEYDLLLVHCQTFFELLNLNAIERWRDHCGISVCWIDEMYAAEVPRYKHWIKLLKRFDHVVLGMAGTVKTLSEAIGRQCHYVPAGVDALRFTPFPRIPDRVIDVYSIGRRWQQIHRSLLNLAEQNKIFYLYDTLHTGESVAANYREHRDLFAGTAKRSRYFLVAPGKMDSPEETKGQIEIGFRYYEGAAAGAVMLGQAPESELFRRMFDWPDSVIEIKPDGSDVKDTLKSLAGQPERLDEISRRNAAGALLRHDWAYRWSEILNIAGLKPTPELAARKRRLRELAELERQTELESRASVELGR